MVTHSVIGKLRSKVWRHNLALVLLALVLGLVAACGGDEEEPTVAPTATPAAQIEAAPTATAASESPLGAPESPLADPNSPLPTPEPQSVAPADAVVVNPDGVEMEPVTNVEIEGLEIKEGASALRGRLISIPHNGPLTDAVVRLAEVYCPGDLPEGASKRDACIWALDDAFSPSTFTDDNGNFLFENIEARDYVLIVGDRVTRFAMLEDKENKPLMWAAPANQAIDIGEYQVNY